MPNTLKNDGLLNYTFTDTVNKSINQVFFKAYLKEARLDTHGNPVEVVKSVGKPKTTSGYSLENYLEDSHWDNTHHD